MPISRIITSVYMNFIDPIIDYLTFKIPPKNPTIPIRYIINAQKGLTGFYVLFLMYFFNNWHVKKIQSYSSYHKFLEKDEFMEKFYQYE